MPPVKKPKRTAKKKTSGSKSKKGSTALTQITTRAQQLQRASPNKIWQDCISAASKEYRAKKK